MMKYYVSLGNHNRMTISIGNPIAACLKALERFDLIDPPTSFKVSQIGYEVHNDSTEETYFLNAIMEIKQLSQEPLEGIDETEDFGLDNPENFSSEA